LVFSSTVLMFLSWLIWLSTLWVLWKVHSDKIFNGRSYAVDEIVEEIKVLSWRWCWVGRKFRFAFLMSGAGTRYCVSAGMAGGRCGSCWQVFSTTGMTAMLPVVCFCFFGLSVIVFRCCLDCSWLGRRVALVSGCLV